MTGILSAMVANLDETGRQDWADRKDIWVVAPVSYESNSFHVPCERCSKRPSLIVCIAADGTFVQSMVIVPRHTLEQKLYEIGYTPDCVLLEHQENGVISKQLFGKWATDLVFPHVEAVGQRLGYGGWGILLLDGCSCHHSDDFLEICGSESSR
jgi:hypothetical protein